MTFLRGELVRFSDSEDPEVYQVVKHEGTCVWIRPMTPEGGRRLQHCIGDYMDGYSFSERVLVDWRLRSNLSALFSVKELFD